MRVVDKKITIFVQEEKEVRVVGEAYRVVMHSYSNRNVQCEIDQIDEKGEVIETLSYRVEGEFYDLLMSANPEFAPHKRANEYTHTDLSIVIDKMNEKN